VDDIVPEEINIDTEPTKETEMRRTIRNLKNGAIETDRYINN
jgi:hypothetical protein